MSSSSAPGLDDWPVGADMAFEMDFDCSTGHVALSEAGSGKGQGSGAGKGGEDLLVKAFLYVMICICLTACCGLIISYPFLVAFGVCTWDMCCHDDPDAGPFGCIPANATTAIVTNSTNGGIVIRL